MDPVRSAPRLTCPTCGAQQDSPGSTVCEVCGADLLRSSKQPSSPSSAAERSESLRRAAGALRGAAGKAAAIPVRLVRGIVAAIMSVVSLILRIVTVTLKTALILAVVAAIVLGLTYIPAVQAKVPVAKELPGMTLDLLRDGADRGVWWVKGMLRQRSAPAEADRPSAPAPTRPAATRPAAPKPAARKPAAAKPAAATAVPAIRVTSTPAGSTVLVNQKRVGRTPLTVKVAPGTYTVTVSRPGYKSVTRTVTVKKTGPTSVTVTLIMAP